jgi:adenylate kinase family enzyme
MKRVLIIGSSGAGKSTFARRLGAVTGLKVIHLDQLYWSPNWVETPKDEWRKKVAEALDGDAWIMDGNYSGTLEMRLEKCDTVIFLDMPRITCLWRILKRAIKYRKSKRPDMADGCVEKFDWDFVKITWNYPKRSKPKVESLIKNSQKTTIRLKSNKEIESFLQDAKYGKKFNNLCSRHLEGPR